MRKSSLVCLIAGFFLLFGAFSASASTVNLIWTTSSDPSATGLGTNAVSVSSGGGVSLTLDLVIGVDAAGLGAFGADFEFDVGSEFDNELNLSSSQELSWGNAKATRTLKPLAPGLGKDENGLTTSLESGTGGPEGQLFGFDLFSLGTGASNLTLAFARMVFVTTANVQTDGLDLFATLERDPFGTAFYNNSNGQIPIDIAAIAASVNLLPEPQSVAMLVLAVGMLTAAGWRRS